MVMLSFDAVPPSITKAFGDLRRFESQLRDEFQVGQLVNPEVPYAQHDLVTADPNWHEALRDERTGLYAPAMLAAQVIVNTAAQTAIEKGDVIEGPCRNNYILIGSIQTPSDDIAPFTVEGRINEPSTGIALLEIPESEANAKLEFKKFLDSHGVVGGTGTVSFQWSRSVRDINANHGGIKAKGIHEDPVMHVDSYDTAITDLIVLGSTARPTLGPLGKVVLKANATSGFTKGGGGFVGVRQWDPDSIREIAPPHRLGLITGLTTHTESFGSYAAKYIDPKKGYAQRFFTRIDADITE